MNSEPGRHFRCCVLIPTYDNPRTVAGVVERARRACPAVLVVDDGSGPEGQAACQKLAEQGLARVRRLAHNMGKGQAVKHGFEWARSLGYSHCFQVDADAQHDLDCMPEFLAQAQNRPEALIAGYPVYDATAPGARRAARKVTEFWVALEAGRGKLHDALLGFRIYPLEPLAELQIAAQRMDFDTEVAVRLIWAGVPVVNLPVGVRYLQKGAGGVSHFHPWRDNLRLFKLHSRLCTELCMNAVLGRARARALLR